MSTEVLNFLLKEYEKKKSKAEFDLEQRKISLYNEIPELKKLDDELNSFALKNTLSILKDSYTTSSSIIDTVNKLKSKKQAILESHNLTLDYLKPNYECKLCNDTGYIRDDKNYSHLCNCIKQKLIDISINNSNITNIEINNFQNFNINLFSDKINFDKYKTNISPRENIINIKNYCLNFIDNFNDPKTKNLLFSGNTGLR